MMTSNGGHRPRPTLSLIAAVARNGVIGADGKIPWRLSTDMKRFKRLTLDKPVIMGRKTAETLGEPLVDRTNIVITRGELVMPGFLRVTSLEEAIDVAADELEALGGDEVIVAGGGEIYAAAMGIADRLYITDVDIAPEGDTYFPAIGDDWLAVSTEHIPIGERDSHASAFTIYDRRKAA